VRDTFTITHGWLDVGDGHTLFWEEWGRAGATTPIVPVHPAAGALELAEAYGQNLRLEWVNSGHLRTDPQMRDALREAASSLLG
jgi:hypothetical protein